MKRLIAYFINRPLIVNLVTFIIILVGTVSVYTLQKETFPSVEFDVILVTANYQGSSSEDVEKLVTIPIERSLKGIDGIKNINALSAEGSSIVYVDVDPDAEIKDVLDDINVAIDTIDDLPSDVKTPRVRSLDNKQRGVIKVALTGDTYDNLRVTSKKLRDKLEENKKIATVNLDGYRVDEIRVLADPLKLNEYEVTLSGLAKAISDRNLNLSAGKLETYKGDILVRTLSEFQNESDIEKVVIRSNPGGQKVRVSDVAKVRRAPEEGAVLQRSQGKEAIFVDVKIKESSDIIRTTQAIKDTTKDFFSKYDNKKIKYKFVDDFSYFVKRRLNILKNNGLLGIFLVFGCLLLFMNFSTSVITSMGAPLAFMVSFAVMEMMGVSMNLISMFGLILVLGMLVDDSIIVAEHFYQKLEHGMNPKKAALQAAVETIQPVTATILTTMVAFGALFFMGGIMGKFLWPVPAVVIICLIASWLECFFILPSHLADFGRLKKSDKRKWYEPLYKVYGNTLAVALKHPFKVQLLFLFILIGSFGLVKTMRFELFPGDDVRTVFLQIKGKVGTPLESTDKVMMKLEEFAMSELKKEEYDQIKAQIGVLIGEHGNKTGTHYGSLILYLTPPDERERSTDDIVSKMVAKSKEIAPDYNVTVTKQQGGPPRGKPVDIELKSGSLEDLKKASLIVKKRLEKIEGVLSPEIDFEEGKSQVVVTVDDAEAKRLGLSSTMVALELRRALAADDITEIRESDEDIEIKVLLDDESRKTVDSLKLLFVSNNEGRRIPITKVAKFNSSPGAFIIRRLDGKRIFSVQAELDKAKATPVSIIKVLDPEMKGLLSELPDVSYNFGGENEDTKESMGELFKSFGIALLCIFLILVVMFGSLAQPIVVMMAIPLGMIGVVIVFKILGVALGFMAMMGIVGLVGVVVNDSIVLVNFINLKRKSVENVVEAIHMASVSRFRPILLTTVTTVAGLLPVAHANGGDPFLKPMALSFAYGLLFATFVTLYFIPCNYLLYAKIIRFLESKFKKEEV